MKEEKCDVHGNDLKPVEVPVHYGLPILDHELIEARNRLFPNAKTSVSGGCSFGAMGSRTEVLVCDECRNAERAWNEVNRTGKNKTIYTSILIILVFVFCVSAQESRKVTVTLKNGDTVEGKFLFADSLNISIGVGSQKISLLWEGIDSLKFSDSATASTARSRTETATAGATINTESSIAEPRSAEPRRTFVFVGDATIKKFYSTDCEEIKGIYSTNLVSFTSEAEAILAGFTKSTFCTLKNSTVSTPSTERNISSPSTGGEVQVKGYYRRDGTYVRPHTRSSPKRKN